MPRRVTMRDVAAKAGVSAATVSYVLNATAGQTITEQTRRRVMEAASALRYVPHSPGRALREGRSRAVVVDVGELDQNGPTLGGLLHAMSEELRRHDHSLVVTIGGDAHSEELLGTIAPAAVIDLTRVTFGTPLDDTISGEADGIHAGYPFQSLTQLRHLVTRGHTRIATVIPSRPLNALTRSRLQHWALAARELGIRHPVAVRLGQSGHAGAVRTQIVDRGCTAVAAYDDTTAVQVITALQDLDVRCPEEVAVIGFDDADFAAVWRPALTTVRVDAAAYGRRAARIALGLEPEAWTSPPSRVIVRASA